MFFLTVFELLRLLVSDSFLKLKNNGNENRDIKKAQIIQEIESETLSDKKPTKTNYSKT